MDGKEIGEHVADQPPVIAFPEIVRDISLQNGDYVYNMHVKISENTRFLRSLHT